MSGHSKWATIKRKKGATDAVRGRVFTKLANLITVAARQGGGDPESNITLRYVIEKARENNVPRENIERAIKRGTGELAGATLEEFTYEAVGPEGAAFIIDGVTDKKSRTLSDLRNVLTEHDVKLAENGSQRWQFNRLGTFLMKASQDIYEAAELAAIEAGAEDVQHGAEGIEVYTDPQQVSVVHQKLSQAKYDVGAISITFVPKNPLTLTGPVKEKMIALLEALDERDDVQSVSVNFAP
jgi:YebC/PmpR family DNA-binding regulatory protein